MLSLTLVARLGTNWWMFKIMSLAQGSSSFSSDSWIEHSNGLVRLVSNTSEPLPEASPDYYAYHYETLCPRRLWYQAFENAGYAYGPSFRKQELIECTEGRLFARSTVSLDPPPSRWEPQSEYPLHPAPMDCCMQATLAPLHRGDRALALARSFSTRIDRIVLCGDTWQSNEAVSVTTFESLDKSYFPTHPSTIEERSHDNRAKRNITILDWGSREYLSLASIHATGLEAGYRPLG